MVKTYRRCQECDAIHAASAFKRTMKATMTGPGRQVRCPACGYEAPMWAFLPAEHAAEGERTEESNG